MFSVQDFLWIPNINLGAFAIYLEPWHADIFEFLDLRKNHGKVKAVERMHFLIDIRN